MAVDAFLILEDIEGESLDAVFKGSIEIAKFNFDAVSGVEEHVRSPETAQARRGAVQLEGLDSFTFSIEKEMDKTSPKLFLNYCQSMGKGKGAPFKTATVYLCLAGVERKKGKNKEDVAWVTIEFTTLSVSQYGIRLDTEMNIPDENITFRFETYKITYRPQLESGGLDKARPALGFNFGFGEPKPIGGKS
jgi:type VI protein secretion system component Hcp